MRSVSSIPERKFLLQSICRVIVGFLVVFLQVPVVDAENRTVQHLKNIELRPGGIYPVVGLIHGWGFLSYEEVVFSWDGSKANNPKSLQIDVVVSTLPEYDDKDWLTYEISGNEQADADFWETIGIGARHSTSGDEDDAAASYYTCCTEQAFSLGLCNNLGRLIVSDPSELKVRTSATILPGNSSNEPLSQWKSSARFDYTTPVVWIVGHCNASSSDDTTTSEKNLLVHGNLVWMSYTSFVSIPVKLLLAVLHGGLFLWYGYHMDRNKQFRIQIEIWIGGVLALAFVTTVLLLLYNSLEVLSSREFLWLRALSDFFTKTTHVVSRCLYVAIALGLGVTRPRLSVLASLAITVLGLAVLLTKETADVMGDISFARRDNNFGDAFNQERHEFLKLQFKLNMIFLFWIPLALLWTIHKMRKMEVEPHKLQRHKWLWRLYLLSLFLTSGMVGLYILMRYGPNHRHGSPLSILFRSNSVDKVAVDEICNFAYWITLLGMAILWKPNPEAPMYGYVLLSEETHGEDRSNGEIIAVETGGLQGGEKTTPRNSGTSVTMELAEFSPSSSKPQTSVSIDSPNADEEVHHDLSLQIENVEEAEA